MKNMKRLTVCLLLAAMLISIFAGTVLTADQSTGDDYSEATELLSVLGFMTDDEQAWTDPITPTEANRVVQERASSMNRLGENKVAIVCLNKV